MKRLCLIVCLCCAWQILAPVGVGGYTETFEQTDQAQELLGGILHFGQDGPWLGEIAGGRYVLSNQTDEGAIRYYYLAGRPDAPGASLQGAPVSVVVEVSASTPADSELVSGAGLLYAFDPQSRNYVAFTLINGGEYVFFVRDEEGFQRRLSGTHDAIRTGQPNQLTIATDDSNELRLSINGVQVASFGSSGVQGTGVGLIAIGTGRFAFDNFQIGPDHGSAPAGQASAGSAPPSPSHAPAPPAQQKPPAQARQLDSSYSVTAEPSGTGRILLRRPVQAASAQTLLQQTLEDLSRYFDGRPLVTGAFVDDRDPAVQAGFHTTYESQPISGLIVVNTAAAGGGYVAVLYDRSERLPGSLQHLAGMAGQMLPAPPTVQQPQDLVWHQVTLADGGSMRLPQGWQVTASNKGMVDIAGPEGAGVAFGIWLPINVPGSVPPELAGKLMVAPYMEPAAAVVELAPKITRLSGNSGSAPPSPPRIIEQMPIPAPELPQAQGAFVHFESANPGGGEAQPYHTLALVITAPTSSTSWMYYFSQVQAPKPIFSRMLPTMLEIWKSWRVSDQVLRERLDSAARNMREIGKIIQSTSQRREQVMENAHADWVEYIRGTRYEKDTLTGELRTQSLHDISQIVQEKNEAAGYERFQEIPLRDFNR